VLKGLSDYHEEYHIERGVPFVAHQRGSMRHVYRSDPMSVAFYAAIDRHIASKKSANAESLWKWEHNDKNKLTLARAETVKEEYAKIPHPVMTVSSPSATASADDPTKVEGWLKATLNGTNVWSRHTQPVPRTVDIVFLPDHSTKNIRIEGTINGSCIVVPSAPDCPHTVTVRNMTAGPLTVKSTVGNNVVVVPQNMCWYVIVDVDGVTHVE
jgi:hypothetical protein